MPLLVQPVGPVGPWRAIAEAATAEAADLAGIRRGIAPFAAQHDDTHAKKTPRRRHETRAHETHDKTKLRRPQIVTINDQAGVWAAREGEPPKPAFSAHARVDRRGAGEPYAVAFGG